ncbi:DODA-type extradiol aromatic ring-opening family dioxygenase [Agarivorans sp. QJM3NY_33]|uniref:DODA-type extradiol aromatic ring-opening family dioxygenase n=1 Tax=Agarivorans sp. QJM3NY_33 TaxID=3421432 RepID=UPI003D7DD1CB
MNQVSKQPALFISHGSPMMGIENSATSAFLKNLGRQLHKPDAIVVFSAHFDATADIIINSATKPKTIHDFYGFPEQLYQLQYPAPGAPDLAKQVAEHLQSQGYQPILDEQQGWDHGVWIPLRLIYPQADIPVLQISINSRLSSQHNYQLGQALSYLSEQNILLLGSGGISHNLREVFASVPDPQRVEKVTAFTQWVKEKLLAKDIPALLDYQNQAPFSRFNHPSVEHFVPLLSILGAWNEGDKVHQIHQDVELEILALDAYAFS